MTKTNNATRREKTTMTKRRTAQKTGTKRRPWCELTGLARLIANMQMSGLEGKETDASTLRVSSGMVYRNRSNVRVSATPAHVQRPPLPAMS